MAERWTAMPDYEGRYEISDLGRVRSIYEASRFFARARSEPLMKPLYRDHQGYVRVSVTGPYGSRSKRVHVYVLRAFRGAKPPGTEGAHLDGNKNNNGLSNLAWVTHLENVRHSVAQGTNIRGEAVHASKLTEEAVRQIRFGAPTLSTRDLAQKFEVSEVTIRRVLLGVSWKHVGWPDGRSPLPRRAA